MLFALTDDRTLYVFGDIAAAHSACEGYDAESGAVRFFDTTGRALVPVFPERSDRRLLGIRVDNDPGPYLLEPGPEGMPGLVAELDRVSQLESNLWFASVAAIRAHL